MPYVVTVESIADKIEELHKKLWACGHREAAAIVSAHFGDLHDMLWVEDESKLQKAELSLIEISRIFR